MVDTLSGIVLRDAGDDNYELRFRKPNTKQPVLIARVHNASSGTGATVVLNEQGIRDLKGWLDVHYTLEA